MLGNEKIKLTKHDAPADTHHGHEYTLEHIDARKMQKLVDQHDVRLVAADRVCAGPRLERDVCACKLVVHNLLLECPSQLVEALVGLEHVQKLHHLGHDQAGLLLGRCI